MSDAFSIFKSKEQETQTLLERLAMLEEDFQGHRDLNI
jgi:hypothetical protein